MVVTITVDSRGTDRLIKGMQRFPDAVNKGAWEFTKIVSKSIKKQAMMSKRATSSRQKYADRIMAKKQKKNVFVVTMPRELVLLDSMKPHFVSLKRGRKITKWVKAHYGTMIVSGKSRVRRGPKGGVKGSLYVRADPFVRKGFNRVKRRLGTIMKKSIRQALRGR